MNKQTVINEMVYSLKKSMKEEKVNLHHATRLYKDGYYELARTYENKVIECISNRYTILNLATRLDINIATLQELANEDDQ